MIFDPMYLLFVMVPAGLLALWAQAKVKSAYAKASQIDSSRGLTGAQAAARILLDNGLDTVAVEQSKGWLSDHYDPRHKVLRLSPDVYGGRSLAALGIAAHEAGHALQDAQRYGPLVLRNGIVPLAGIGSNLGMILLMIGLAIQFSGLMIAGAALFGTVVVFQLVNLPCEFNASTRARQQLLALSLINPQEDRTVKKVLDAAAMTYVAATIGAVLQLLYFVFHIMSATQSRD